MKLLIVFLLMGCSLGVCAEKSNIQGIEYFIEKPEKEGVFPAIVMIHGAQYESNSLGGQEFVNGPFFTKLVAEDVVAVAISIPGFGGTEGKRDYCGPIAQDAVIQLIDHLKTLSYIDSTKIALLGASRGAAIAAMVATRYEDLAFQVLIAGKYDFREPFPLYFQAIQDNYIRESQGNWEDRSALYHQDKIKIPTLILHGALDPLDPKSSAEQLHHALLTRGVMSRFVLFPHLNHFMMRAPEVASHLFSFLREHFYDKQGIGVMLSPTNCYPQITGFLMDYPGAQSSHLQLGDIVLAISSSNDDSMISILHMPVHQVSNLILGAKGTMLRLKVAHLDGLEEEVVIRRMD